MPDELTDAESAETVLLVCHVLPARSKVRRVAAAELLALLDGLGATAQRGGPLAERRGVFWMAVPVAALSEAATRLPRLGYTVAVDALAPLADPPRRGTPAGVTRWRGRDFRLVRLYEADAEALRERAVDRRTFLLETPVGVRPTRGYRGSSEPLARRGLPVADARVLVNLVGGVTEGLFVEPFAGAGGIVLEAMAAGWRCVSFDSDARLRHGLNALASQHYVADARHLPLASGCAAAIATEPPYESVAHDAVADALGEMQRVLRSGGRLALLCVERQAEQLRTRAAALGLAVVLDAPIDRKGLPVVLLCWRKPT